MKTKIFIALQHIVPQHTLSRCVAFFAKSEIKWIKNLFISQFIKKYQVNLAEAKYKTAADYRSFNHFFTRELEANARTIDPSPGAIASPADGAVSQLGKIKNGKIFQAKGFDFSVEELIARNDLNSHFQNGEFATIYLSPKDYHRVHMPIDGTLTSTTYIPGKLFSVSNSTAENVDRLFARNERLVCHFETELGPVAIILVGAMIVAGIEVVWQPAPLKPKNTNIVHSAADNIALKKGEELGRFLLGSTVIMLFGEKQIRFDAKLANGSALKMGEMIATTEGEN
jgi:phosphatidylserine decarboxylase